MQLPGIVSIGPDQPELIKRAADVLARGFVEEPWFEEWLTAIDELGATPERKVELLRVMLEAELEAHAEFNAVYATEDFAGVAGGYLASEFGDRQHEDLEAAGFERLRQEATPEEMALLDAKEATLANVSNFSWAAGAARDDHAAGLTDTDDHIYFYAWTVDAAARGTGAFRRMTQPFFDYADAHGLNCYLECYSDNLESLYRHVGFETIKTFTDPAAPIYERGMVRRPNA